MMFMNHNECTAYVRDLGLIIKEKALEAKQAKESSRDAANHQFDVGRLMAFHEVVSLMQQQADAFGIPLKEINLDDLDPEEVLL
jgi:hypothetical protein